jgi:glucosylceramidase
MHNAFVNSGTSGYTHWWCAQQTTGDNALIRLQGNSYFIAARLWAFAGYFRFARPGATRVEASSNKEDMYVSAYVNKNGSLAVPIINAAHFPYTVDLDFQKIGGVNGEKSWKKVTAYLTDNSHNVSNVGEWAFGHDGARFQGTVEPRAMKTFFFE